MPQQKATRHKGNKATRNAALLYASMPQQKATRQREMPLYFMPLCLYAFMPFNNPGSVLLRPCFHLSQPVEWAHNNSLAAEIPAQAPQQLHCMAATAKL